MARKIAKPLVAALAAAQPSDLDVLHPERQVRLGARVVTVREYGHIEWLRLLRHAEPLVAAIATLIGSSAETSYESALGVLADHADALAPLVAQAADLELAEFDALLPDEGELLLMTWWGVNGRFFVARAVNRLAVQRAERAPAPAPAAADTSAGARSTPP